MTVNNRARVHWDDTSALDSSRKYTVATVNKMARYAEAKIISLMLGPKWGEYASLRSGGNRRSAPGEAPAVDAGNLIRSVGSRKGRYTGMFTGTFAPHSHLLEQGARDGELEARPAVEPAIRDAARIFGARVTVKSK